MSGASDLRRDPAYWCKVHRRYLPYGRTTCLLCELDAGDTLDTFAAVRRQRVVNAFPKRDLGGQSQLLYAEERRVLRRALSVRKFSKTTLIARDPIKEPIDRF